MLGNLDINFEVGKGNLKNLSQKEANKTQPGSKPTRKQPKITFNYLYSKFGENIEHNTGQMGQKKVNETNLDSSFKLKSGTHTCSADKGEDVEPSKKFVDSEACVEMTSGKCTELANENLPFGGPKIKGILEEYDCLDVDDEIMDMSGIIQNIVCGLHNQSVP
jgi:hypothetical protein